MASTVDQNFHPRMFLFGKTPETAAAPEYPEEQLRHPASGVGSQGFLGIDLNVAPPEDGGSQSPAVESGGTGVSEVSCGNLNEIRVHSWEGEISKIDGVKQTEGGASTVKDSEKEKAKNKGGKNTRWDTLIEVAGHALLDYGESARDKESKAQNRKRGPRRKIGARWDEFEAAPAVVVRSTRGRAVAMPNKYRDSVLHAAEAMAVAEVRFSRRSSR